jgi:hypothetical protein
MSEKLFPAVPVPPPSENFPGTGPKDAYAKTAAESARARADQAAQRIRQWQRPATRPIDERGNTGP